MPIDFSYLEGAAPQEESTPIMSDTANVTIRVDADSMLLCDGEYIDQVFKAGVLTKIQMGPGQHLLEFLYTEDPDIKIEKEVDFPESGKSYLVLIKGLKDLVDAAEAEAKQKAEEEARKKAEEEARKKAEEEARVKAEAEAKRKAEEEKKRKEKSGAINGHDYVDLGLPSGLKWATCNVGASSPEECGDYYAWGEVETKSSYTESNSSTYHKKMSDISGNRAYDVACKKWGSSWRLPTYDEFDELVSFCEWKEATQGGKKGYMGIGPNGNSFFLPAVGCCESLTRNCQDDCCYWASTPVEGHLPQTPEHAKHQFAHYLTIDSFWGCKVMYTSRALGLNVRPVSK